MREIARRFIELMQEVEAIKAAEREAYARRKANPASWERRKKTKRDWYWRNLESQRAKARQRMRRLRDEAMGSKLEASAGSKNQP